jgi:hypothetical protein
LKINGTEYKIRKFTFSRSLGLEWFRVDTGEYRAVDPGPKYTYNDCTLSFREDSATLRGLFDQLPAQVTLSDIEVPIFGNDVDYTGEIVATITDDTPVTQVKRGRYTGGVSLVADSVTYLSGAGVFPSLDTVYYGADNERDYRYDTHRTQFNPDNNGAVYLLKSGTDIGTLSGTLSLPAADMADLLKFQRSNRKQPFSFSGFPDPFGNGGAAFGRLISLSEIRSTNYDRYTCRIKISQELT